MMRTGIFVAAVLSCAAVATARDLTVFGMNGEVTDSSCSTSVSVNGKSYAYALGASVGSYKEGATSPDGAYSLDDTSSTYTDYTYYYQICGDMSFDDKTKQPQCGTQFVPTSNCPDTCKDADGNCGTTCGALQSQKNTGSTTSYCWTLGQYLDADGAYATISLIDPTDPFGGVSYVMGGGDDFGCPSAKRSLTINLFCPDSGRSGSAVEPTMVKEETTCEYAMNFTHPAGCPTGGKIPGKGHSGAFGMSDMFVMMFFLCPCIYLGVGAAMNHKAGQTGMDLVPNAETWREVPSMFTEGIGAAVDGVKSSAGWVVGKVRGGESGGGFSTIS